MEWFWDAYVPDINRRSEPFASPLRASDEQLVGLPPAFVIVDEADVLRDEGEAYAARLAEAGVEATCTRYDGQIHAFFVLPAVIPEALVAVDEATRHLRAAFGTS